jgi:hypothetical protein
MSVERRRQMIEPEHSQLSIARQCELVSISRSGFYYRPAGETSLNLELMRLIDTQFLETPWYGSRQMARHLRREGYTVGRKRVRRLMAKMGLAPIYQRPRTTVPHPEHRIYPYLLRDLVIDRPNQVWCADITYIPMRRGFLYLVAIMDWMSRKVLAWRVSNTMDVEFCLEALDEALVLPGSAGRGSGAVRETRNLQHRQSEHKRQFPGGLTLTPIDRLVGWRRKVSRCGLIPAALIPDRCPVSCPDRVDCVWQSHQSVPRRTAGIQDCIVILEDAVAEIVLAQELPDVFCGVEFRRVGRLRQQCDVVGHP